MGLRWLALSTVCLVTTTAHAIERCPDLAVDMTPRTISIDGKAMSGKEYRRMRWAPGHHKPVDAGFARAPDKAVDTVLAVEAQHPELVPGPYRAPVAASPRDVAQRLAMARCEIRNEKTLRRGMHDALLAYLLARDAATAQKVSDILFNATRSSDDTERLSPADVEIEDALSHAALPPALKLKSPLANVAGMAATRLVHRCGSELCTFAQLEGKKTLVRSDVRDHGYDEEIELTPAQWRVACRRDTGSDTRSQCEAACHVGATRRYRANDRAMGIGDDAEAHCKSECVRSCR